MDEEDTIFETLEGWVMSQCDAWREHYESNYEEKHNEYYRLWRGIWAAEDKSRESERSRLISPALQQAVESSAAEIEEATFGRGRFFDIEDDDPNRDDIQFLRNKLTQDFKKQRVRRDISECVINAAVVGTGIAEITLDEVKEYAPGTEPVLDGQLEAVGVTEKDRVVVGLRPIQRKNFLIDPLATSIENALGCATDEFVSRHQIEILQEEGVYNDVELGNAAADEDIEPDRELGSYYNDKVRLTKYFGLVPSYLLEDGDETYYTEAIVVIANGGVLLKAQKNPYMMQDRPIIAFQWDITPGVFDGRGVCEKGYNSQKALDTEIRARVDALALTIHPMMGLDATRLPRGFKWQVRPGKSLLFNGDPAEIARPLNFGNVDQITFAQSESLQRMLQQATGAVDSAGIAGSINGEATAAGISMSLGAIIKRQKRTLLNFQESFLIPFVEKAAWRYMQFDPDNYPVNDYSFVASSTLGIMAREYEVTQLVQLLQTTSPDSPTYPIIITSIIDNMNLSNREQMIKTIEEAMKPSPEQQQAQQAAMQREMEIHQATIREAQGRTAESMARAKKYNTEANAVPDEIEIRKLQAITTNLKDGDKEDREFERRYKVAELMLKEKQLNRGAG